LERLGYLDPLVTEGFPASTEHQKLLHRVCQDECKKIVNKTLKNIYKMTRDIAKLRRRFWAAVGAHADGTAGAAPPGRS